jgi:ABC-type multidrug transport system fused ATPase/permease subunit
MLPNDSAMRALSVVDPTRMLPREVRNLLLEDPKWLWLLFGMSVMTAVVEAAALANFLFLGTAVVGQDISDKLGGLISEGVLAGHSQRVLLTVLSSTFIALVTLRFALSLTSVYLSNTWSSRVTRKLHKRIMQKIITAPINLFEDHQLGEIIHGVLSAPVGAGGSASSVATLVSAMVLISTLAVMLLFISPWLLTVAVVIAALWFVTIVKSLQNRIQRLQEERYRLQALGTNIATDTINGIRDIRALASEDKWLTEFSRNMDLVEAERVRIGILGALPSPALLAMLQAGFAAAIMVAAFVYSTGDLVTKLPILGVFAYGLLRVYPSIGQVSAAWLALGQAIPNIRAAEEWVGFPEDCLIGGTHEAPSHWSEVRFEGVSFSYNNTTPVLLDAHFCIKANKTTAIVGASGAGKSTIVDLLLKFRSPNQGEIWIGDRKLNDVMRSSWLAQVGLVRQDVFLFAGTIRDNLLAYKPDATDKELNSACRQAGALGFITNMPDGLDTRLSERGTSLSGGQRQRIAIARALLRNSAVLMLDEAMSAVDGETEELLLQSLLSGSSKRTILLISHRLTTVQYADHIVVLDGGRVVEQGTHEELLAQNGRYLKLFATQIGEEPVDVSDAGRH